MIRGGTTLDVLAGYLRHASAGVRTVPVPARNWMKILKLANEQMLTPAVWNALQTTGRAAALPRDVQDYLATVHRLNRQRNDVLRRQALELIGALNDHNIAPMLLKGALALFDGCYDDPAVRIMRDIDVMVPASRLAESILVLRRLGYRTTQRYPCGHHAYGDFARPHDPGSVDLHVELVDPSYVLPASEVWKQAISRKTEGGHFFVPCSTHRIMHHLLHAQIHYLGNFYRGELQLMQLYEFSALARHFEPDIDWPFIEDRMRAHRLTTALRSYLLAAGSLFGLSWPLATPPGVAARVHYRRCRVQLRAPALNWLSVPWGNLRGAFAWHRMRALHGQAGGALWWRCRHALSYIRKKGLGAPFSRLFRLN